MDPSHAVIPNASITLFDPANGLQKKVQSGPNGDFALVGIRPSTYTLRIEHAGFAPEVIQQLVLNVGDRKQIAIALEVGAQSETVTVSTDATLITTESSVSNVVDGKYVQNMPLNGRSFEDLILLSPGAVTNSPQNTAGPNNGQLSVDGESAASNSFQVDGVSANTSAGQGGGYADIFNAGALPIATALGTTQSIVPVEDLQEFRSETSSFAAEYGRTPGGQFEFSTKSGTDKFHGDAFDYIRNDYFNANDWFNNHYGVARQALRQNDFGGTLGGPIPILGISSGRDRAFFFLNYEGLRLTQPIAAYTAYVPSDPSTFAADPSNPSNVRQNSSGSLHALLNAFPLPNGPDLGNGLAAYTSGYSAPSDIDTYSARVDRTLRGSQNLFFRYSRTTSDAGTTFPAIKQTLSSNNRTYTAGLTSSFGPYTNELRANFASSDATQNGQYDAQSGATPTDPLQDYGYGDNTKSYALEVAIYPGNAGTLISVYKGTSYVRQLNITDALSLIRHSHNFKTGVDFRRFTSTNLPESPLGFFYFYSAASEDSGIMDYGFLQTVGANFPAFVNFSAYAQDNWQATPDLTVNYGVRWDYNPPPINRRGPLPYTVLNQGNLQAMSLAPPNTTLYSTDWNGFAPRLGLSYRIPGRSPGHETIIRAGGGLFYDAATDDTNTTQFYGPGFLGGGSYCPYSYCSSQGNYTLPLPPADRNPPIIFPATLPLTTDIYVVSPHLTLPYALEYNTAIEQALGTSNIITFTYVGASLRKQMGGQEFYVTPVNPDFQHVEITSNRLRQNYNSLQAVFQHRFTKGLYSYAAYTWAHAIGQVQPNIFALYRKADLPTDVRNNFNAVLTYDLPSHFSQPVAKTLGSGWGIDLRYFLHSGYPLEIYGPSISGGATTGGVAIHPDVNLVAPSAYVYGSQYPGGRALNPAAFAAAPVGTVGNAPQNYYRGFGLDQLNVAARRSFDLYERLRLDFRAEAFNIANHPNFGTIDATLGDVTFGQATNSLANGVVSGVGGQYQPGGPRSMQFALKLIF